MATIILRPDAVAASTGLSNISNSFDNDNSTYSAQNNVTASVSYTLEDLGSSIASATINSFTISVYAKAGGKASACSADVHLVDPYEYPVPSTPPTLTWSGSLSTQTTSAYTTKADGSSALSGAYINACGLYINPNNQGIQIYEAYITIDYTLASSGYGNKVNGVNSANIGKVDGVETDDIEKVIGV